jgi:thioredoxin 1
MLIKDDWIVELFIKETVLKENKMIEVKKFGADWCVPCKMLAPIIENMQRQIPDVNFTSIDVDTDYELSSKYNVRSVPTVVIERDGHEIQRFVGVQSEFTYKNAINEARN